MNRWAFALAFALVVLAGCSGGGGSSSSGGGTGGNPNDSSAFITIPNTPGQLQNVYLTGQGRAAGDLTAVIRRVAVDDGTGFPVETLLNPFRLLLLNGYTQQIIPLNIPTVSSRLFTEYTVEIQELREDDGVGGYTSYTGNNQPLVGPGRDPLLGQGTFDSYIRIFPGRQSAITIRLDDSMFQIGAGPNGALFDRAQFEAVNYDSYLGSPPRMNAFLSDYVVFDLSNLATPDQPDLPDGSGKGTALWVSGDNFAVGLKADGPPDFATPDPKPFFVLTPAGYVEGSHVGERTAVGPNGSQPLPGTYALVQPDPQPPVNPTSRITALMGTYKNFTKTIAGTGGNPQGFEIIAFPSSQTDDPNEQGYGLMDIVLFNQVGGSNGVITTMYFGQIDLNSGTFSAFPVSQINDPTNTNNEIVGTVSNFRTGGGSATTDPAQVRSGRYTIDTLSSVNLPPTFSTTGRFVVYRR